MLLIGAKLPATELTFEALRSELRVLLSAVNATTTPTAITNPSPPSSAASRR
jgi:hypothetical protein